MISYSYFLNKCKNSEDYPGVSKVFITFLVHKSSSGESLSSFGHAC